MDRIARNMVNGYWRKLGLSKTVKHTDRTVQVKFLAFLTGLLTPCQAPASVSDITLFRWAGTPCSKSWTHVGRLPKSHSELPLCWQNPFLVWSSTLLYEDVALGNSGEDLSGP